MKKKKVLIITYYWPPSGGAGVQRWLKFSKYLPDFGWEPVIYTPSNPEAPAEDPSLMADVSENLKVIKRPIFEPFQAYKLFVGQKKEQKINAGFLAEDKKPGKKEGVAVWIRGNFFIPDARMGWIRPSVRFLKQYLKENPVDAIVSTGPPHSMHLIAKALRKRFDIPWIADFRDPWTNIDFYKELKLTRWADAIHHKLEKQVATCCDALVTVSNDMTREFTDLGAKRCITITNGYDKADYERVEVEPDSKFSIVHVGSLPPSRNPEILWKALSALIKNNPQFAEDLEIRLIGKVDVGVKESVKKFDLDRYLNLVEYVPHGDVPAEQKRAALLLLVINNTPNAKGILTGKFYEYLAANRPVFAIGPEDGEVNRVLKETGAGTLVDFNDSQGAVKALEHLYLEFKNPDNRMMASDTTRFTRKSLAGSFASLLDELVITVE